MKKIGESAFAGCRKLKEIKIPKTVEEIEDDAFLDIDTVCYNGNADGEPWGADDVEQYDEEIVNINIDSPNVQVAKISSDVSEQPVDDIEDGLW